ncbi:probable Ras GTPase-activating protein isoform X3 [Ctenocephalides felis]|uniref:probable Ras GTPase-activating protein isoform X3 n=1 Tax=Ctenocephalides felis TaxID=7515 RepID=UPI000E6E4BEE|nr:probable Ras GTPase-activating protein isoform X3 [Ctenocephalides felis]
MFVLCCTKLDGLDGECKSKTLPRTERSKNADTSYEKACRRGSAPATPVLGSRPSTGPNQGQDCHSPQQTKQEQQHTPSRLASFFSKRSFRSNPLKRTKSVTKLERCRRGGQNCGISSGGAMSSSHGGMMVTRGGLRGSRSHESLLGGHAALSTIELGCGEVVVAPVHASVAGRQWCFEVRGGSRPPRYFCCSSREERDLWMHSLRQSIQPSADQLPRTDNSLKLWLLEAKCLPPKRKYYCDVLLDGTLHARTAAKARGEILFWGELFDLTDLPTDVKELKVEVYREGDRKRKRDKQILVGSVRIPVNELDGRYFTERWYPILSEKDFNASGSLSRSTTTSSGQRDGPTLRLKARYQSTRVRPLADYENFTEYLRRNYKLVCESLEPVIGVKAKEDIASSMVLLMQSLGQAGPFLADVVSLDLLRVGDQRLTFRGNSLATKAMEAFLKLTGEQYLQDTLGPPVRAILASSATCDCEVDPARGGVSPNSTQLLKNQNALREAVSSVWTSVKHSHEAFPLQIRECFATFRRRLAQLNRQDMADNLISASIFLRFLCPAILSPSLFNITNEYPDDRAARNLTLVAKTLQTLANFTKFQGKEGFMEFLNDFLLQEAPHMKEFLYRISAPVPPQPDHTNTISSCSSTTTQWSGHIDRGKQLSLLQGLLLESLPKVPPNKQQDLQELKRILDALVYKPEQQIRDSRGSMVITDNIFRFNDPTVQNTMPVSNVSLTEAKLQKSPSTIITPTSNCVQNSLVTSSTEINNVTADDPPITQQPSPTRVFNYPKKSPNLGVRAATLPRNTYNQICTVEICDNPNEGNLIPIGLETSSAFVRKSPTPKHSKLRTNSQASLVSDRLNVFDNDRINCNVKNTANLDELSDLFAYADEQNVDLVNNANNVAQNHVQNKGSNISIGQLSNVCSSGYQSITTQSQSSSPTDLINPIKIKMKTDNKSGQDNGGNNNMALAFENPVYHMDFQNKNSKKLIENSLTPSSSEENLQRPANYISSPLDTPSPVMRRNLRIPRTNPGLSYRNNRMSDEKRIDEHRYEIDRNVKDLASVENEQNYLANKFKRSLDKINSPDYGYGNNYEYHRNYDNKSSPVHQTIGIPLQHSHSNNSLYYPNSNLSHSYSNTSLQNSSNKRLQYFDQQGYKNGTGYNNDCNRGYLNKLNLNFDEQNYECSHGYKNKSTYDDQHVTNHHLNYDSENMNPDSAYQSADVVHCSGSLQKKLSRRLVETDSSSESEIQSRSECSQRSNRTVEQCEMEIARLQRTIDRLQAKLQRSGKNGHQQYTVSDDNKMKSIIARMLSVEEERKREQMKMSLALSHKQRVIDAQGQQIAALDAANSRLLSALSSLRHTSGPTAVNLNSPNSNNDADDEA